MGSSFVFAKAKKAEKPKVNATKRELIDWQGAAGGREIPSWVNSVLDGDNLAVANELKIDSNKTMVFVLSQRGPDLDFVKTWVDNVDARREISTSISQVVATTASAAMEGYEGGDEIAKEKAYTDATNMASAIELQGLLKTASYWTKLRSLPIGVNPKKAKNTDYTIEYEYFVVFTMDRKAYDKQVSAAMNNLNENTSEERYLKKVLAEKLSQTILPGNTLGELYN